MAEVPKVVLERLRAAAPAAEHPEADVLAAFAEQTLSPAERESVLQHLAACGDCREVVAFALPASEEVPAIAVTPARDVVAIPKKRVASEWWAWPGLRWGAVAAGVLVVASALWLRSGKAPEKDTAVATLKQPANESVSNTPLNAPNIPVSGPTAGTVSDKETSTAPGRVVGTDTIAEVKPLAKNPAAARKAIFPATGTFARGGPAIPNSFPGAVAAQSSGAQSNQARAGVTAELANGLPQAVAAQSVDQEQEAVAEKQVQANASGANSAETTVAIPTVRETVTVAAASPAIETAEAELSTVQKDAAPVSRAKAAVPAEEQGSQQASYKKAKTAEVTNLPLNGRTGGSNIVALQTLEAEPQWRVSSGTLQRSLDEGASWQMVLRADHALTCRAARGMDMWVGGEAGTVFHSTNGGGTWSQVHPATKDQSLSSDVVSIENGKPGTVTLTTRSGESWATVDNGQTWEKK